MLKELNTAFSAVCSVTATTAAALEDGAKILRLKGVGAKQMAALETAAAIQAATAAANQQQLKIAEELLAMVEEDL